METTTTMEDYLECIYSLSLATQFVRVNDVARRLQVHPSTATRMIQRLNSDGYVIHEPYKGLALTLRGRKLGSSILRKHQALETLLRLLGVKDGDVIYQDVEGIEHHLSPSTLKALVDLVDFFQENPSALREFQRYTQREDKSWP